MLKSDKWHEKRIPVLSKRYGLFTSRYEDKTLSSKSIIFTAVVASVVFGVTWMDVQYMNSRSTMEANGGESVEKPLQTASSSYRDVR